MPECFTPVVKAFTLNQVLFHTAAETGARLSELLALTYSDIDFKSNPNQIIKKILKFLSVSQIKLAILTRNRSGVAKFSIKNILIYRIRIFLQKISKKINISNTYLTNKIASSKLFSLELDKSINNKDLKKDKKIKYYFRDSYREVKKIKNF